MNRRSLVKIQTSLCLAAVCLAVGACWWRKEDRLVSTLKENNGGVIKIYTDTWCEISCPFMYEVCDAGEVVQPKCVFLYAAIGERLEFSLVQSGRNRLVAVVAEEYPDAILILHDFAANESWPHDERFHGYVPTGEIRKRLLGRLTAEFRDRDYWVNTEKTYSPLNIEVVATLNEKSGGTVEIRAIRRAAELVEFTYEVTDGGEVVLRKSRFLRLACGVDYPKFSLIPSKNGRLVAVVTEEYPDAILILHDFAANESWPHDEHSQPSNMRREVRKRLLRRFTTELPRRGYWLNTEGRYPPEKR